ncbi:hypothetical protein KAT92_05155, partial [Candidatus Babeliales bacterium]|nr:hypothetical protein [Candidatus Babeliales bacterium]
TRWKYTSNDSNFWMSLFGPLRYNWDSSGTWKEIKTNWKQVGSIARWEDTTRGYYKAVVDSSTKTTLSLELDTTHIIEILLDSLCWFDPTDSQLVGVLPLYTNNDSVEVRWDTIIFHGIWYDCDAYFVYGRDNFSCKYIIGSDARDSLSTLHNPGDYLGVRAEHRFVNMNADIYDDGTGSFDPATDWFNVDGALALIDSTTDSSVIIEIYTDIPEGDSVLFLDTLGVSRWYDTSDGGTQYFYEFIDFETWEDSVPTGEIMFHANYSFTANTGTTVDETFITYYQADAQNQDSLDWGGYYMIRCYEDMVYGSDTLWSYSFVRVDFGSIEGSAVVDSVLFDMYASGSVPDTLVLFPVLRDWPEGKESGKVVSTEPATYYYEYYVSVFGADSSWTTGGVKGSGTDIGADSTLVFNTDGIGNHFVFDDSSYTAWVQDWIDGDGTYAANHGVKILATSGIDWNFYTHEYKNRGPAITVWYHTVESATSQVIYMLSF